MILEIVVGRTGDVESVKQWRYKPALQGGRPVKVYLTVRVEFGLV